MARPENQVIAAILARRSTRFGYERRSQVPDELLRVVTDCGLSAPSSKNARPWRFHVVTSTGLLDQIAQDVESAEGIDEYVPHDPVTGAPHRYWGSTVLESAAVLREVPAAIFIESRGVFSGGRGTLAAANHDALVASLMSFGLENIGIGCALENMWIAAVSLGLSAAFLGDICIAEAEIRTRLGLSGDLVGALGLGYATVSPPPARPSPAITQVEDPVIFHGAG